MVTTTGQGRRVVRVTMTTPEPSGMLTTLTTTEGITRTHTINKVSLLIRLQVKPSLAFRLNIICFAKKSKYFSLINV